MKEYILIAGVNGTGKSSFRGVLEGHAALGHIVDPDIIAKINRFNEISAGKQAIREIHQCIRNHWRTILLYKRLASRLDNRMPKRVVSVRPIFIRR